MQRAFGRNLFYTPFADVILIEISLYIHIKPGRGAACELFFFPVFISVSSALCFIPVLIPVFFRIFFGQPSAECLFPLFFLKSNQNLISVHENRTFHQHAVRGEKFNLLLLAHTRQSVL